MVYYTVTLGINPPPNGTVYHHNMALGNFRFPPTCIQTWIPDDLLGSIDSLYGNTVADDEIFVSGPGGLIPLARWRYQSTILNSWGYFFALNRQRSELTSPIGLVSKCNRASGNAKWCHRLSFPNETVRRKCEAVPPKVASLGIEPAQRLSFPNETVSRKMRLWLKWKGILYSDTWN